MQEALQVLAREFCPDLTVTFDDDTRVVRCVAVDGTEAVASIADFLDEIADIAAFTGGKKVVLS